MATSASKRSGSSQTRIRRRNEERKTMRPKDHAPKKARWNPESWPPTPRRADMKDRTEPTGCEKRAERMLETPEMPKELWEAIDRYVKAAVAVEKEWAKFEGDVHAYPPYLPRFPDHVSGYHHVPGRQRSRSGSEPRKNR